MKFTWCVFGILVLQWCGTPRVTLAQVASDDATKTPEARSLIAASPANPHSFSCESLLLPDEAHPEFTPLKNVKTSDGERSWEASNDILITSIGATSHVSGGAHLPIPMLAGRIRIEADVMAGASEWTALAIGRKNLTKNFWQDLAASFYISTSGRFHLFAGKKDLFTSEEKVDPKLPARIVMTLDTVERTVSVTVNQKSILDQFALPPSARLDQIEAVGFRIHQPHEEASSAVSRFVVTSDRTTSTGFVPTDITQFFVRPQVESRFEWKVQSPGPSNAISYSLHDYQGLKIEDGHIEKDAMDLCVFKKALPQGYFEITFPAAGHSYGIVSLDPTELSDEFFGIDAGLSWLEPDSNKRKALIKIMARSGIGMSRERLGLRSINPQRNQFNWGTSRNFEAVRQDYAESHVKVLEILQGGAGYLGSPQNLALLSEAWSTVANHWSVWGATEAENEPDLKPIPADQYVPLVKTLSYALANSRSKVPLVTGVFARLPPGPFFDTCFANGMLEDSDAISFHSYDRVTELEATIDRFRTWLRKSGKESMPIWQTESGWAWPQGTDRPLKEDDERSAAEIAMKGIESKSCGVARYFPFVYVHYDEGPRNFGMMGKEGTPSRSMAAYAMCVKTLSGWEYQGDLIGLSDDVRRARVFKREGSDECVAVIYTTRTGSSDAIDFPYPFKRVAGLDGRSLQANGASIPIPDSIVYIWLDLNDIRSRISTTTKASELHRSSKLPFTQARRSSPLVFEFLYKKSPCRPSVRRYLVTQAEATQFPIHIRLHNLSAYPHVFHPEITWPGATTEKPPAITLPPMGSTDLVFSKNIAGSLDTTETRFVTIAGHSGGIPAPLPLAIPLTTEGTIEQVLASNQNHQTCNVTDLSRWKPNIARNGSTKFEVLEGDICRVHVDFVGGRDNWSYPRFHLEEKIDESRFQGFAIRARIKNAASNVGFIAESEIAKPTFWATDLFPADGEWHVAYVPFSEFQPWPGGTGDQNARLDPASWKILCIGMGGKGFENDFEISHLMLVGSDQ